VVNDRAGRRAEDSKESGDRAPDARVTPDAQLPELDRRDIAALRAIGRTWPAQAPTRESLPVDPSLRFVDDGGPVTGRLVRIKSASPNPVGEREEDDTDPSESNAGHIAHAIHRLFVGAPLRNTALAEQRMGKLLALPVLSPDALSSVAYGPEAMMAILVLAGSSQLSVSLPIGGVLVVLMVSVGLGYRQVIRAYPHGGGSYIVASHSLGPTWGLFAGAGLILDYILTVAVSVAAGVAAVTSALPSLTSATVPIGLAMILLLVLVNLRGARDAGAVFALPTYMFVLSIALVVVVGLIKSAGHGFHAIAPPEHHATEALGVLLILRAFSSGATAMTGIEVISNAVPVFKEPAADNARTTLSWMIFLLVAMFVGVLVIAHLDGASPGNQTVLSQIAHDTVGSGPVYAFVQISTTLVLLIAANSAVNGFPRLLYFMARDEYVPRLFLHMGDRLSFSSGIIVLAVPAAILYAVFNGQTAPLIPLFAIGVFVAFTLAQSAMVAHWWRHREHGWQQALVTNLVGAVLSGAVVIIAAITKFTAGAWIVVILIPAIVLACRRINRYFQDADEALAPQAEPVSQAPPKTAGADEAEPASASASAGLAKHAGPESEESPEGVRHLVVVSIAVLDRAALRALAYAASMDVPTLALHVSPSDDEAKRFRRYWTAWGNHLPLEVLVSPYRATLAPLANYIEALHHENPEITLTVVVPELIPEHAWQLVLQNRVAPRLRRMLIRNPGIVITSVPFHLRG
jgi:amino acid transporter